MFPIWRIDPAPPLKLADMEQSGGERPLAERAILPAEQSIVLSKI
jgi:hypothetical protein